VCGGHGCGSVWWHLPCCEASSYRRLSL
jgi:hypothetical protein